MPELARAKPAGRWRAEMPALNSVVIIEFCNLCNDAYTSWQTRKYLFDLNPDLAEFQQPHYEHFFARLADISQKYWLHQLAKLHDPAVQSGQINLTINYVTEYGQWDDETATTLKALQNKMLALATPLKTARNKLLSHNDLASILKAEPLGAFAPGEDVEYFDNLKRFANIVHEKVVGSFFPFDDFVRNDIEMFVHCFKIGRETIFGSQNAK